MTHKPKFHIRCDMEGVSGVVAIDQVTPGSLEYQQARAWLMEELTALIDGLVAGGASEVSIYDEHWSGRNVDVSRIPAGVRVFCGKPPYRPDWPGGLEATHDGLILHGLHSMAGTGQTLCHTYEPDIRSITLNGIVMGEIGVEAAIAGDLRIPLALIVADSAGVEEAAAICPGVRSVVTKISRGESGAECFSLPDVVTRIRETARQTAEQPPAAKPLRLEGPVTLSCQLNAGSFLSALRRIAAQHFTGDNTIVLSQPTATAAWAEYWRLKLLAQSHVARGNRE